MGKPEGGTPPNIFQYLDYRLYPEDYCQWRRANDPSFARDAGLPASSSSLLPAVIKGRRSLSQNLRVKFSRAMGLPEREAQYFETLVQFNQAKGMTEKNHFFARLSTFHNSRARVLSE